MAEISNLALDSLSSVGSSQMRPAPAVPIHIGWPALRDGLRAMGTLGQTSLLALPGALDEAMPVACFWNSEVLKL